MKASTDELHLLEREGELGQIRELARRLNDAHGGLVLIEGEAGIGKSAILRQGASELEREGLSVLTARGGELERDFPLGVARQLLEREVDLTLTEREGEAAAGPAELAVAALRGQLDPPRGAPDPFSVQHGLYWLVAYLSEMRPLVLLVDDAHWSDLLSLRWLAYLARRLEGLPIGLVMAARPLIDDERVEPLDAIRREAQEAESRVSLEGLSPEACAELITAIASVEPRPDFVAGAHALAAGNPFLLRELVRTLAEEGYAADSTSRADLERLGPTAVASSVVLRLGRLKPGATHLARAASVLGGETPLHTAAALAGLGLDESAAAAHGLAVGGILSSTDPLEFRHPLVRAAIYGDVPEHDRLELHARAATLLREHAEPAERVAAQLLHARRGGSEEVVATLREAAKNALARGAPESSADYLARALNEPPSRAVRGELLYELGRAELALSRPAAAERLSEALRLSEDPEGRSGIALDLARALTMVARFDEAIEVLDQALEEIERSSELAIRLESERMVAARLLVEERTPAAQRLADRGEELRGRTAAERLLLANLSFESHVRGDPAGKSAGLALTALANGSLLAEEGPDRLEVSLAAWTLALDDELSASQAALEEIVAASRRLGSALGFTMASSILAFVAQRRGELATAESHARAVLDFDPKERWPMGLPLAVGFLAEALLDAGRIDEAEALLADYGFMGELPDFTLLIPIMFSRARLRRARREEDAALEELLEAGRRAKAWGSRNPSLLPWRVLAAEILASRGRVAAAQELIDEQLALATAAQSQRALGQGLRVAALAGDTDVAQSTLERSMEHLEAAGARLELARSAVELGSLLRRTRRRKESREPLYLALELAAGCGAEPLAARARTELAAAGARPRKPMRSGAEALTPSERRVCELAQQGLANPEIAQTLFVTRATVESHLRSSYRKLDISSRRELDAVL